MPITHGKCHIYENDSIQTNNCLNDCLIGYCNQTPFIINATVRENILFGLKFSQDKYDRCIEASALKSDLEILPNGDSTQIGERGINMSGGQKARVSFCRALYRSHMTQLFLFDDCLSAVDANVGNIMFERGICNLLYGKTRIVVMNSHLNLLKYADYVIIMDDGTVVQQLTFGDLIRLQKRKHAWEYAHLLPQFADDDINNYDGGNNNNNNNNDAAVHYDHIDDREEDVMHKLAQFEARKQLALDLSKQPGITDFDDDNDNDDNPNQVDEGEIGKQNQLGMLGISGGERAQILSVGITPEPSRDGGNGDDDGHEIVSPSNRGEQFLSFNVTIDDDDNNDDENHQDQDDVDDAHQQEYLSVSYGMGKISNSENGMEMKENEQEDINFRYKDLKPKTPEFKQYNMGEGLFFKREDSYHEALSQMHKRDSVVIHDIDPNGLNINKNNKNKSNQQNNLNKDINMIVESAENDNKNENTHENSASIEMDKEKQEEREKKGQLIIKEDRNKGKIKRGVIVEYFKNAVSKQFDFRNVSFHLTLKEQIESKISFVGGCTIFCVAFLMIMTQVLQTTSDIWLTMFSESKQESSTSSDYFSISDKPNSWWLGIWTIFVILLGITALLSAFMFGVMSMRASQNIHMRVLYAVLRAPVLYFDRYGCIVFVSLAVMLLVCARFGCVYCAKKQSAAYAYMMPGDFMV